MRSFWLRLRQTVAVVWVTLAAVACGGSASLPASGGAGEGAAVGASGAGGAVGSSGSSGVAASAGVYAERACVDSDGKVHPIDETFSCACNQCLCTANGIIQLSFDACLPCAYQGALRAANSTFVDRDGCNSCSCGSAEVSCTTQTACKCDASKEWWRRYAATDARTCTLIDFACDSGLTQFGNDCGCGCEEPAACPEYAGCDSSIAADQCARILAACPYLKPAR